MTKRTSKHRTKKYVTVPVDPNHPLLKLKDVLPWTQLFHIADTTWRKNGKNVGPVRLAFRH